AIESRAAGFVTAVAAERDEALLQRILDVRGLRRVWREAGDQVAVVAAAAHLQHAPIPRERQIDFELHVRRRGVLRFDDAGDFAEVTVLIALLARRDERGA